MKIHVLLSLLILSTSINAAEADNFTAKKLQLVDISSGVNQLANNYLIKATESLNNNSDCDDSLESENLLYTELKKYFNNHSKGELTKAILYTDQFEKNALPLNKSVYGEWKPLNGYLLGRKKAATSALALSPLIKIGTQDIGVDKLEHMFGMGSVYFKQYYQKNKSIISVLKSGILKEKTYLGGNILATGVFSYADLSANFNGMRFWNHVLLKNDDILGEQHNLGPYISCINSKWKVNTENPIDFKNYIDESMDESVNCSKMASRSGVKKIKKSINELGMNCGSKPELLDQLKIKYSPSNIGHFILNDDGIDKVKYFNEF
jgi:hypothetical protein